MCTRDADKFDLFQVARPARVHGVIYFRDAHGFGIGQRRPSIFLSREYKYTGGHAEKASKFMRERCDGDEERVTILVE